MAILRAKHESLTAELEELKEQAGETKTSADLEDQVKVLEQATTSTK